MRMTRVFHHKKQGASYVSHAIGTRRITARADEPVTAGVSPGHGALLDADARQTRPRWLLIWHLDGYKYRASCRDQPTVFGIALCTSGRARLNRFLRRPPERPG